MTCNVIPIASWGYLTQLLVKPGGSKTHHQNFTNQKSWSSIQIGYILSGKKYHKESNQIIFWLPVICAAQRKSSILEYTAIYLGTKEVDGGASTYEDNINFTLISRVSVWRSDARRPSGILTAGRDRVTTRPVERQDLASQAPDSPLKSFLFFLLAFYQILS